MPSFMHRFPRVQNLDDDTPSLKHSPSTISSTSKFSISVSLRRRVTTFTSKFHFRRSRPLSRCAVEHISSVPWPRSPSRSPSPPSPDIRPPSGLGRRASSISELETLNPDSPPSPLSQQHFRKSNDVSPTLVAPLDSASSSSVSSSSCQGVQARRVRGRTYSSPALLSAVYETPVIAPAPQHRVLLSTPQTFEPRTPRHARRQARQNPPIPLSLVFAHIPRAQLPALARVSRRFCTAAQLVLYRTLEHAPTAPAKADACVASLAGAPHLAELVTSLTIPTYPFAHGPSFTLALRLSLRSMRALATLTLPSFDADILSAAPPSLTRLTLLADTLPFAFFDRFLAVRPQIVHLALPNFVGVPPGAGEVPSTAVPHLTTLDASPGLAAALAPGRPVERVTLRVASTLYDGLRPAALFDALGSELKELALVLAPDVDARTRGRLLGALAKTGEGLEALELRLEGKSDEVSSRLFRGHSPPSFVPDRGADLRDVFCARPGCAASAVQAGGHVAAQRSGTSHPSFARCAGPNRY